MAVMLYDNALLAKLQKWTADTDVTITGISETRRLFEVVLDKNNDKPILIKVSLNRPIRMALKEFHPEVLFKLALKPGDLIVRKICPSVRKICTSDFVSIFRVGSINENYIAIYPASRSTFEDACLNGLVSKIKLGDVTKLFWI